jgi:hypothetical protein
MAVNDGEKASTIFAVDRSGRRREILRRERQGFDSDGEGQGIQNANPLPLALPHPGWKSGTFYLAKKRNFLFCVDSAAKKLLTIAFSATLCHREAGGLSR